MYSEKELVSQCQKNQRSAQEKLYKLFSPKMYGVCLRYSNNQFEAEEILQEGFIKVFLHLKNFRSQGSLEGWIRRTIINTAINYYRKNLKYQNDINIDDHQFTTPNGNDILGKLSTDELMNLIKELPDGYRMIFNLYVIEGFSHKEIGAMMNINENTSKSQLSRARQVLQNKIKAITNYQYSEKRI